LQCFHSFDQAVRNEHVDEPSGAMLADAMAELSSSSLDVAGRERELGPVDPLPAAKPQEMTDAVASRKKLLDNLDSERELPIVAEVVRGDRPAGAIESAEHQIERRAPLRLAVADIVEVRAPGQADPFADQFSVASGLADEDDLPRVLLDDLKPCPPATDRAVR